jgi:hypothetical protein
MTDQPPFFRKLETSANNGCSFCSFLKSVILAELRWLPLDGSANKGTEAEESVDIRIAQFNFSGNPIFALRHGKPIIGTFEVELHRGEYDSSTDVSSIDGDTVSLLGGFPPRRFEVLIRVNSGMRHHACGGVMALD